MNSRPTTLAELTASLEPHTRAERETVAAFLNRRLRAYGQALLEEPHVAPNTIDAICDLTGDDPVRLILDQLEAVTGWDEPFKNHVLQDFRQWFLGCSEDELVHKFERHREHTNDRRGLIEAALDGRLKLVDDEPYGQVAVIHRAGVAVEQGGEL